jgi:hypothetical protein
LDTLGTNNVSLSFYKSIVEYLTTQKYNITFTDMIYTEEKKNALLRTLLSRNVIVSSNISALHDVNVYLTQNLTIDQLPIKASLNRVMATLQKEKELIQEFKTELCK